MAGTIRRTALAVLALGTATLLGCSGEETTTRTTTAEAGTDANSPPDAAVDAPEAPDAQADGGADGGGSDGGGSDGAVEGGGVECPITTGLSGCPDGSVDVPPDADLQALVTAQEGGTTFCLQPGTHHDGVSSLKSGETFTSPSGTTADGVIEHGAKTLTGWTQVTINSVTYWTTAGGAPLLPSAAVSSADCETGYPGCFYPQDLFVDDVDYVHVTSLAGVKAGTWYYDYAGGDGGVVNNVYLASSEDPTSHTVELSQYASAFSSVNATSITIQGLIIEKYGAELQSGAIVAGSQNAAPGSGVAKDWVVQNNEVRLNHGGIAMHAGADSWRVLCNDIHNDGTVGFGSGETIGGLFSGNTIAFGNQDHELCGFECVMKVSGSSDCSLINNHVISYNTVHDNRGNGLWSDVCARSVTYDHNTIYNNDGEGIRVEISEDHAVTNNAIYGNGTCAQGSCILGGGDYEGIVCAQCSSTTIADNYVAYANVAGGPGGIVVSHDSVRDNEHPGFTVPVMMSITNNTIVLPAMGTRPAALAVDNNPATTPAWITADMFAHDTYCVTSLPWTGANWFITTFGADGGTPPVSFATWQQDGQDSTSSLTTAACPMP